MILKYNFQPIGITSGFKGVLWRENNENVLKKTFQPQITLQTCIKTLSTEIGVEKSISPQGDGNNYGVCISLNIVGKVEKSISPQGDGNMLISAAYPKSCATVEKSISPQGDGNNSMEYHRLLVPYYYR